MALDSEQKKVLKSVSGSCLGIIVGLPLLMWVFGKLDSWKDAFLYLGVGLLVALFLGVFYVLGSKIPRK